MYVCIYVYYSFAQKLLHRFGWNLAPEIIHFFFGPAGKIIRMTNSAYGGNVGGRQRQTSTD